jgi:hypothetical protein
MVNCSADVLYSSLVRFFTLRNSSFLTPPSWGISRDTLRWVARLHERRVQAAILSAWRHQTEDRAELGSHLSTAAALRHEQAVLCAWREATSCQIQIRIQICSLAEGRRDAARRSSLMFWRAWAAMRRGRRAAGEACSALAKAWRSRLTLSAWRWVAERDAGRWAAIKALTWRRSRSALASALAAWASLVRARRRAGQISEQRGARILRYGRQGPA